MTYTRLAILLGVLVYAFIVFLAVIGAKAMIAPAVTIPVLGFLIGAGNLMRGSRAKDVEDEEA